MDNILITTSTFGENDPSLIESIKEKGLEVILNPYIRKLAKHEVSKLMDRHQPIGMIAGVEPLTKGILKKAKNLKIISRCGIGLDSVDLKAANELGIIVTNTPDAPTIPVAELTLGIILTLMRRIHLSDSSIRNGKWERPMGKLLYKKTVGIIGCGRIGTYLARLLVPFECTVLGCDIVDKSEECYQQVSFGEILREADVITLHIPYSPGNDYFMNSRHINSMKKGAFLINTSRGGIVDEAALYDALKNSRIGGAALDCFEEEPYEGPLKQLNNVLLTAHIGSYAKEGRMDMEKQAVGNLLKALVDKGMIE